MLFAEADPMAGWGSLILQGGAFGLLVYIVTVMYPQGTKDARDERDKRDANFAALLDAQQVKFEERNIEIVRSIDNQTKQLGDKLDRHTEGINRAVATICKGPTGKP